MASFPTLIPNSRTFTPGEYPHSPFAGMSGKQNRTRHSNVMLASQLRLGFFALTEAEMLSILSHYRTQRGSYESFALPSAIWSGVSTASDYQLSNYGWRYIQPPTVEDMVRGGYNVELVLETVPPEGASLTGFSSRVLWALNAGKAAAANGLTETFSTTLTAGLPQFAGLTEIISASVEGGVVGISEPGLNATVNLSVNGGASEVTEEGLSSVINLAITGGSATATAPPPPSATAVDPNFTNTSLLLHFNGADNSTTFTDSSPNVFTVTPSGDAKISTVQQKYGSASGLLDGTGDFLTVPGNTAFELGTGDFTVEAWVRLNSILTEQVICSYANATGSVTDANIGWNLYYRTSQGFQFYICNGSSYYTATNSTSITTNTWYHVAAVRSGGSLRVYVNGAASSSTSANVAPNNPSGISINVGRLFSTTLVYGFNGYIDDLRITKGVARYISSFTPPTEEFPDSAPPAAPDPYFANTSLLLHYNGANNSTTFADSSSNNFTLSRFSVTSNYPVISTAQSMFGGSSGYLDGDDHLRTDSNSAFEFGTGDFTVEAWIRFITINRTMSVVSYANSTTGTYSGNVGWDFRYVQGQGFYFSLVIGGGSSSAYNLTSISTNTWYHVAAVRRNGVINVYVNGIAGTSVTNGSAHNVPSTVYLNVGRLLGSSSTQIFAGYMDELRITKGVARYTGNFTPPTAAFPDFAPAAGADPFFANVSLLMPMNDINNSTSFEDKSYNGFTVGVSGDTKMVTAKKVFGSTSAFFDGSGDFLTIPGSPSFVFGTGDFTIEAWVQLTTLVLDSTVCSYSLVTSSGDANVGWALAYVPGQGFRFNLNNGIQFNSNLNSASISINTWYHLAAVRIGGSVRVYVNGVGSTANTINVSHNTPTGATVNIGRLFSSSAVNPWVGYIDDLRITKGVGRYTANFTPPTEEFPNS